MLFSLALGESKVEQEPLAQTGRAQPWYDDIREKLGLFQLSLGRDTSPSQVLTLQQCFASTHLYIWVDGEQVEGSFLSKETIQRHSKMGVPIQLSILSKKACKLQ